MDTTNIIPFNVGFETRSGSRAQAQREALEAARHVVGALMTPGQKFPTREELIRAWALIRAA